MATEIPGIAVLRNENKDYTKSVRLMETRTGITLGFCMQGNEPKVISRSISGVSVLRRVPMVSKETYFRMKRQAAAVMLSHRRTQIKATAVNNAIQLQMPLTPKV